jgi:pSer/pThr/pTyr-binding forkhead associated (FHA) protein
MSEQVLTVLKFCLLALIYLFLARVVWVVGRELRGTPAPAKVAAAAPAPRTARKGWRVVILQPDSERGRGEWIDGEATIGRGGGCTISLPADTFASQVHARIVERDGQLFLEDLGSTNGTFLNGKQVAKTARLRKGDQLQIGHTVLRTERA